MSRNLPLENIRTVMSVLKDHYYRLASDLPTERLEAASALLLELAKVDSSEDWDYALNRLVKGLITTRQAARFGFSMALTEVIHELIAKENEFTVPTFLKMLKDVTILKSSMKGKEERAVLFGRLFGLQALINSKVLIDSNHTSQEIIGQFISILLDLASEKSWLRESATFTLCQFIKVISECDLDFKDDILLQILQETNDNDLNLSTEGIAIYLSIPNSLTLSQKITNPKSTWKNGDPFSKGNLPVLAKALKDVEVISEEPKDEELPKKKSTQKGSWTPKLPFVWDLIVEYFNNARETDDETDTVDLETSKKRKKTSSKKADKKSKSTSDIVSLKEFWLVVIDQSLFSEKSSHERKYWGFEIFQKFLTHIRKSEQVEFLFTPNFFRCLINQTGQSGRYLNKVANQTLTTIQQVGKHDSLKSPFMISRLCDSKYGGCWNFDLLTKSKTIDSLVAISTKEQVFDKEIRHTLVAIAKTFINIYHDVLDEDSVQEPILRWCLDKLLLLVRSNKTVIGDIKKGDKILETILNFLIVESFFTKAESKVSDQVRKYSQDKLNAILSDIINSKRTDCTSWSLYCVNYILELTDDDKYSLKIQLDDEIKQIQLETIELLATIATLGEESPSEQLYCFELMISMVLLQLYLGDEEAVQVLGELKMCFEDAFTKEDENPDFDATIVLTEILLSLASRKSTLTKKLVNIIWSNFLCELDESSGESRLNEASLQLLYDVLVAKENKEGQQKLFEGDGEYEEEAGSEDDNKEDEDEDEEDEDEDEDDDDEDDDDEDDDDEDDEDDEDDDNDDADTSNGVLSKIDQETNLKLAKALNLPATESGEVKFSDLSDSDCDGEYESDSMDDEQMMAMDEQLASIFKERKSALDSIVTGNKRKADVEDAKEQMIFFKHRILDLLDLFFKLQTNSYLCLTAIEPLITLINLTLDKNLGIKAHKLLKTRISKTKIDKDSFEKKFSDLESQTTYKQKLSQSIAKIQQDVNITKSNQAYTLACNQACIILSKNLILLDELYLEPVIDIYADSLKTWATNPKSKLQASLFFDFINWLNSKR